MPYLPVPKTNEETLSKNTKEQYEALGCFVEAFEMMVNEVREICIERICAGIGSSEREQLIEISFHHTVMTAKPLYDIMRAIIAELLNSPKNPHHANRANFKKLLGYIEDEYSHLYNKRNELLHGTWLIGYVSDDDPNAKDFTIRKYKTSADGLVPAKELPKNASELLDLRDRCQTVLMWVSHVDLCLQDNTPLDTFFKCEEKKWFFRFTPDGPWRTLQEKWS